MGLKRTVAGSYNRPVQQNHWLSRKEVETVFASIDTTSIKGRRAMAVVRLGFSAGLRRAEIAGLRWHDVSLERRQIHVLGKGQKQASVYITDATLQFLQDWRAETENRAMGDSELRSIPIRLPKRHRPKGRKVPRLEYPAPETVAKFIQHLGNCDKAKGRRVDVVLELAAYTGLRRGELCGLAWDDLDLEEGTPYDGITDDVNRIDRQTSTLV